MSRLNDFANEILYLGLNKEQFKMIRDDIAEDNRSSIRAGATFINVFILLGLLLSIKSEAYYACQRIYVGTFILNVISGVWAHVLIKKDLKAIHPVVILFSMTTLIAGIGIAFCQPHVRTVTMIACTLVIPVIVMSNTFTNVFVHLVGLILYYVLCVNVVDAKVFYWGLSNLIIFSVAGDILGHVVNKQRAQRFVYAETAKALADVQQRYAHYDELTGLQNRRAFEEKVKDIVFNCPEYYCVVMLDLNGLKKANDTYGHDAGDELIKAAAECLVASFKESDSIYRIGGDEFCVINSWSKVEAEHAIEKLRERTLNWKGNLVNGFTISAGVSVKKDDVDISNIIKEADQKMYESKRCYYEARRAAGTC
jgi:diguanylate cyclase (GGDEF)-like protein